jgi:hypothetical protein
MRSASTALFLLAFTVGCGDNIAQVTGRVTLDNKPLPNATVLFMPTQANKGAGSQGKTNENGEFTLRLMTKDLPGAVPGKHKVSIAVADDGKIPDSSNPAQVTELVPAEYNVDSTLIFEVPSTGTTAANFDLKTPPPMPK